MKNKYIYEHEHDSQTRLSDAQRVNILIYCNSEVFFKHAVNDG